MKRATTEEWDLHFLPVATKGKWFCQQFHITGKTDPISCVSASRLAGSWRDEMLMRGATGIRNRRDTVEPIREYMSTKDGSKYSYISTGEIFIPNYVPKNYYDQNLPHAAFILPTTKGD